MTSESLTPEQRRQRLGIAVAQTREGHARMRQEDLRKLAVVARKTLSRLEGGHEVDIRSIRKVDAALAQAAPQHWHVGKAEEILSGAQPSASEQPGTASSGAVALASMLLATLDDDGYPAYRKARAALLQELGNEVLAEVDKQFKRLATGRSDVTTLRHTS